MGLKITSFLPAGRKEESLVNWLNDVDLQSVTYIDRFIVIIIIFVGLLEGATFPQEVTFFALFTSNLSSKFPSIFPRPRGSLNLKKFK